MIPTLSSPNELKSSVVGCEPPKIAAQKTEGYLRSWPCSRGTISIIKLPCGQLEARLHTENGDEIISHEWIVGLPPSKHRQLPFLKTFLTDTYVRLAPHECLTSKGYSLQINHKIRGGIVGVMEAVSAALGLANSAVGFFTADKYKQIAEVAVKGVKATFSGAQATIIQADESTSHVIDKMHEAVQLSLDKANHTGLSLIEGASDLVETTGTTTAGVISLAGSETRETAIATADQVKAVFADANKRADRTLRRLGLETQNAIKLSGEEARKVTWALSNEVKRSVTHTRKETNQLIESGEKSVKEVLEDGQKKALRLIAEGGKVTSSVIAKSLADADAVMKRTIADVNVMYKGLIDHMREGVKGLLVDVGEQGRLLIQDTGKEIRVTADEILTKAMHGQQVVIKAAGVEARLTIQEAGKEIRSTLYQLPTIAAMTGETFGRNVAKGLLDGILGSDSMRHIKNEIENYVAQPGGFDLVLLLGYVREQTQLKEGQKCQLYETLIRLVNVPKLDEELRKKYLLYIGVAVFLDKNISKEPGGIMRTHLDVLLTKFPDPARGILMAERENSLKITYPLRTVLIEEIDERDETIQEQRLLLMDAEEGMDEVKVRNATLEKERETLAREKADLEAKLVRLAADQERLHAHRAEAERLEKSLRSSELDRQLSMD